MFTMWPFTESLLTLELSVLTIASWVTIMELLHSWCYVYCFRSLASSVALKDNPSGEVSLGYPLGKVR